MSTRGRKADIEKAIKQLNDALDLLYEVDGLDERVIEKIGRAINLMDRQYSEDFNEEYRPLTLDVPHFEDTTDPDEEGNDEDR